MINIFFVFYLLIFIFAFIGSMRGWAKEILVTTSIILALALIAVLENLVPFVGEILRKSPPQTQFWVRTILVGVLVFFGYQSPNLPTFAGKTKNDRIQDSLLGFFLGAINGYIIVGTFWYYLHAANYPFKGVFIVDPKDINILKLISATAPQLLTGPTIYISVVLAFIFVIIVFL